MIDDADRSLADWLGGFLPPGTAIRFDAPEPGWVSRPAQEPFVGLFLYDITEDITGLAADAAPVRDTDGHTVARQPPIRRYRLSYLLTTWAADVRAGHDLLGRVLAGCCSAAVIPAGRLRDPIAVRCAPPREGGTLDLFQALGIPPGAGLILVLTVPLVPVTTDVAAPVRSRDLGMTPIFPSATGQPTPRPHPERGRITEHPR